MNTAQSFKLLAVAACAAIAATPADAEGLSIPKAKDATPPASDTWRATVIPGTCIKPEYPLSSLRKQEKGTSVIELKVDASGAVTDTSVRESSGSRLLDQAAAHSMSACRFKPARDSTGTPMASGYPMRFEWRLEDAPPDPWVALRPLAGGSFAPTSDLAAIPFTGDSAGSVEQRAKMLQAVRDEAVDKAQCPSIERVSARIARSDTDPERRSFESWTIEQCGQAMRYIVAIVFPEAKPPRFRFVPLAPTEVDPFASR